MTAENTKMSRSGTKPPAKKASSVTKTGRNPRAGDFGFSGAKPRAKKAPTKATLVRDPKTGAIKVSIRKSSDTIREPGRIPDGMILTAAGLLGEDGGKHLSAYEWAVVARRGVRSDALDAVTGFLHVSQADLSDALDIPVRTLIRRKSEGHLNRDESAKLVRVARVIERAEEVFESGKSAREWLKRANASLDGETPFSLLDTEFGAESVMDTLGRIEHGVFA